MSTMTKSQETTTGTVDNWDQTDPQWLVDLTPEQLGTGLLLVKQPDSDKTVKVHKSDIRYDQFKIYAGLQSSIAIKWVPHTISDQATLLGLKCHGYCETTCVKPGCICDSANHQCS
jgi:hypothetical protein